MNSLNEKLKKDAEILKIEKGTGLPIDVLIMHAVKQAENDNAYKEKLEKENFAATILYMCEWFVKELVESEMTGNSAYVSDEMSFKALNEWVMANEEERKALLEVLKDVKHPKSKGNNPFMSRNFITKKELDNIAESFKELPIMQMLIKKYYKEPATSNKATAAAINSLKGKAKSHSSATTKKTSKKKEQPEQISLDMFEQLMVGNETKKEDHEEENKGIDKVEETKVQEESKKEQSQEDISKECYRYYSLHRPLGPGAIPQTEEKALLVVNFDECKKVEGTNISAWGYVEYANPLSEKVVSDYELTLLPTVSETDSEDTPELNVENTVEKEEESEIEVIEKTEEKEPVITVSEPEETSEQPKQIDLFSLF